MTYGQAHEESRSQAMAMATQRERMDRYRSEMEKRGWVVMLGVVTGRAAVRKRCKKWGLA